jgi:hypothetical protein
VRPHGHTRVRADASVLAPGNFMMDTTVRPSHERPNGHRPSVRYRPHDNLGTNQFWLVSLELTLFLDFLKLFVKMGLAASFVRKKIVFFGPTDQKLWVI